MSMSEDRQARNLEMMALYEQGETLQSIAESYSLTKAGVSYALSTSLPTRYKKARKMKTAFNLAESRVLSLSTRCKTFTAIRRAYKAEHGKWLDIVVIKSILKKHAVTLSL